MSKKEKINKIFKAVADPTRREIFHLVVIASTALSLTQIADQFAISRQGVTKHLQLLEDAGLITTTAQGRERFCMANLKPLQEIKDWLAFYDSFWDNALKRLDTFLQNKKR